MKGKCGMQLLPVIDLFDGQVVRAVAGERANYRPIRSGLVDCARPGDVMRALLALARFEAVYVADLDAITRHGSDRHFDLLVELAGVLQAAGGQALWLDAGEAPWLPALAEAAAMHGITLVPVIGTESLAEDTFLATRMEALAGLDCVLSLDFRHGTLVGPIALDEHPRAWPRRVIAMELSGVGVGAGPDLSGLERIVDAARRAGRGDVAVYAAGGVRDAGDLRTLAARGAAGVLLASALHDRRIDAGELAEFTAGR
jgi:phosphoribosylformimino-5-aminoimidazole carboxamide ribotide isomerase